MYTPVFAIVILLPLITLMPDNPFCVSNFTDCDTPEDAVYEAVVYNEA